MDQFSLQQLPGLFQSKNLKGVKILNDKAQRLVFLPIVFCSFLSAVFYWLTPNVFEEPKSFLLLAIIIGPFVIYKQRLEGIRATKQMVQYGLLAFVALPLLALISLIILESNFDSFAILISYTISIWICALLSQLNWKYILMRKEDIIGSSFQINYRQILEKSIPLMLVSFLMFSNDWVDKFMIKLLMTSEDVGLYSAAFRIVQFFALPLISINAIAAPRFAELFKSDKTLLPAEVQRAVFLIIISSVPIAVIILAFPEQLLSVFGSEFIVAKYALIILLIGQIINVLAGPVGIILKMTEHQMALFKIVFVSIVINIILNIIWIPIYGLNGAAISTAISILILNGLAIIYIKKHLGFYSFIPKTR